MGFPTAGTPSCRPLHVTTENAASWGSWLLYVAEEGAVPFDFRGPDRPGGVVQKGGPFLFAHHGGNLTLGAPTSGLRAHSPFFRVGSSAALRRQGVSVAPGFFGTGSDIGRWLRDAARCGRLGVGRGVL